MKKRGVSLMVSYTLLVVIAISLSVLVYAYLRAYVPGERMECPSDISLTLEGANCQISESKLNISLVNRGLFNVSGVYIRVGPSDRDVKLQVNEGDELFSRPIAPNQVRILSNLNFDVAETEVILGSSNSIEIQPAILEDGFLVPCDESVVTYPLVCS